MTHSSLDFQTFGTRETMHTFEDPLPKRDQ